ncbi:MAG: GNAT family N-acetyltransferase [Nocardioidaceae bacterium]
MRVQLGDSPGTLAALAERCGAAGLNILGLQVFPGVDSVTDELVLRTPDDWQESDLARLIESAGGRAVSAARCTDAALTDQPTRYVQAARTILAQPAAFPEIVAHLFDAEADPIPGAQATLQDVMDLVVGDVDVQVRRTAPFTATERARGEAIAGLVTDVLARSRADALVPMAGRRLPTSATPSYVEREDGVSAVVDGTVVGVASLRSESPEPGVREVTINVDLAWQRRGIGTRLLNEVAKVAARLGATELVFTTRADNQAVLPLVLATGLRSRMRMTADRLTVRMPLVEGVPVR